MESCWQPVVLLWLTAVAVVSVLGNTAEAAEDNKPLVKNLTNNLLQVIPQNGNSSNVTKLMVGGNLITLNETDQLALASYPTLVELQVDGNLVTAIPAKYFSGVPLLRVLSLTSNNISSLDPEAFSGLNVLTELDLSHNLLTSLPGQLIKGLHNLQVLNLQENPWNCSCSVLSIIGEIITANVTIGGPRVICASPEQQTGKDLLEATALCSPLPPPTITTEPQTPVTSQQSRSPSIKPNMTPSSSQNHSLSRDDTTVRTSHTWKFTVCVAALALMTSMVIVCAIKGPSWYKVFHNYRHRRLHQEDEEDFVSTVFSGTERYQTHHTFTFKQQDGQPEQEEEDVEDDEYFEDPYIRKEDMQERRVQQIQSPSV